MALSLLDFTSGNVDFQITPTGGSPQSLKCVIGDLSFSLRKDMVSRQTLCDGIWENRIPQKRQGFISATKFASKGVVISDPLALFSTSTPLVFTFTADTSCTITGSLHETSDALGGTAGGVLFGGGVAFETAGAVSTSWVVS